MTWEVIESPLRNLIKRRTKEDLDVLPPVALPRIEHYNARAKHRPAWKDRKLDATHRLTPMDVAFLLPDLVVGGKRDMGIRAHDHGESGISRMNLVAKVLLAQLGISIVLAAIFWGLNGFTPAYSALLGGLTCVVPNAFLALRLVASRRERGAGALVRAAYIGELGKLALTVLMFGAAFTLVEPLAAGPLFAGFIAAQVVPIVGFLMRDGDDRIAGPPGDRPDDRIVTTSNRNGD